MTRLDCVLGTATGMRTGITLAAHHAAHRTAFGRKLADQPLMADGPGGSGHRVGSDHDGGVPAGRGDRPRG